MEQLDRRTNINSLLAASVIAETNICVISSAFVKIPMVSVLLMALLFVLIIFFNGRRVQITRLSVISFVLFFVLLAISLLLNGPENVGEQFVYFLVFGMTAMMVVSIRQDLGLVLKYLQLIYGIHLLIYYFFQRNSFLASDEFWLRQMGVAYGFAPSIVIGLFYLFYHKVFEEKNIVNKHFFTIASLMIIVILSSGYVIMFDCGTRGAFIVVVVATLLIIVRKFSRGLRTASVLAIIAASLLVYQKFDVILDNTLSHYSGGNVKVLLKMSQMSDRGDFSNGREMRYNTALQLIEDNPITGYGVGYFEKQLNGSYVHQLFLELLLECGIVGLVLFLIPIVRLMRIIRNEKDDIAYLFLIFIFSCCFLPLMFTASFWLFPPFWYGYFYALKLMEIRSLHQR